MNCSEPIERYERAKAIWHRGNLSCLQQRLVQYATTSHAPSEDVEHKWVQFINSHRIWPYHIFFYFTFNYSFFIKEWNFLVWRRRTIIGLNNVTEIHLTKNKSTSQTTLTHHVNQEKQPTSQCRETPDAAAPRRRAWAPTNPCLARAGGGRAAVGRDVYVKWEWTRVSRPLSEPTAINDKWR